MKLWPWHTFKQNRSAFGSYREWLLLCTICLGLSLSPTASASKYAAIVVHADTGKVLHSRRADSYRHPASITKVMTLYMLFEAIESGKLNMQSRLKVSRRATKASPSKLYLAAGDSITVRDAIGTLITKSANDVAIVVAEALGKSERQFAKMMTQKARSIGMTKTTFRNASGLHHSAQRTTARDIATLAQRMRRDFPQYYPLFSMKKYRFKDTTYTSHNKLLSRYPGMEGMKTGYINASGFNLVAVAKRNHQRLITVVLGGRTGRSRDTQVAKLMDLGFSRLPNLTVVRAPLPRQRHQSTIQQAAEKTETPKITDAVATKVAKADKIAIPKVLPRQASQTDPAPLPAETATSKVATVATTQSKIRELAFTVIQSPKKTTKQSDTMTDTQAEGNAFAEASDKLRPLSFTIIQ